MQVIQITSLSGHSPYDITICDITNTYCYSGLTGVTSVPVTINLPTELLGANEVLVVVTDSIGCQEIQYAQCLTTPTPTPTPTITPTITPTNISCNCISINNPSGLTLNFGYTQCDGSLFNGIIYSSTTLFVCGKSPYGDVGLIITVSSDICVGNVCPGPSPTPTKTPTPTPTLPVNVGYFQDSCNPSYEFTLSNIPSSFTPLSGAYYVESSGYKGCVTYIGSTTSTNLFSFIAMGSQPSINHCQKANFIYPCPTLTPTPSVTPTLTPTPTITPTNTPTPTLTPTPTTTINYTVFKVIKCCNTIIGEKIIKFMRLPSHFLPGTSVVDNNGDCWSILSVNNVSPNSVWNNSTTYLDCELCIIIQTCNPITPTPTPTPTICIPELIYSGENFTSLPTQNGASFKPDGTILYITLHNQSPTDAVCAYSLLTPWDVSTITLPRIGCSIASPVSPSANYGSYFSPDGSNLFLANASYNSIIKYTLSTPWDVSTSSYSTGDLFSGGTLISPSYLDFSPDGLFMFVTVSGGLLKRYTLTTAWDISSGVTESQSISAPATFGIRFQNNGYYLFSISTNTGAIRIVKRTLSIPYDLTSIILTETSGSLSPFIIPSGNFYSLNFKDGYKGFIGVYFSEIYSFNLTCEWDINGIVILPTPTPTPTNTVTPTITPTNTPTPTPTSLPILNCSGTTAYGGAGISDTIINLSSTGGTITMLFYVGGLADKLELYHGLPLSGGTNKVATSSMSATGNTGPFDNVYGTPPLNTVPTATTQTNAINQFIGTAKGTIPDRRAEYSADTGVIITTMSYPNPETPGDDYQQVIWWQYTPLDYSDNPIVTIRVTGGPSPTGWAFYRLCI